jgi:hypothetical protein
MAQNRVKESCLDQVVYLLTTNRISGGRMLFQDQEKYKLKELLFAGYAKLSYQVIDYYCRRGGYLFLSSFRK